MVKKWLFSWKTSKTVIFHGDYADPLTPLNRVKLQLCYWRPKPAFPFLVKLKFFGVSAVSWSKPDNEKHGNTEMVKLLKLRDILMARFYLFVFFLKSVFSGFDKTGKKSTFSICKSANTGKNSQNSHKPVITRPGCVNPLKPPLG